MCNQEELAVRLNAVRKKAAEVGSVARFVASELWAASPLLTVALLAVSWTSGITPLLQVWAIRGLVNALMRPAAPGILGPGQEGASLLATLAPFLPWLWALVGALILNNVTPALNPLVSAHLTERVSETLQRPLFQTALPLALSL